MTDTHPITEPRRPAGVPRLAALARADVRRAVATPLHALVAGAVGTPLLALLAGAVGTPLLALVAGLGVSPAAAYDGDWHDPAAPPPGFAATLDVPPRVREALVRQAIGLDAPRPEAASAPAMPGSPVRLSPPDGGPGLAAPGLDRP